MPMPSRHLLALTLGVVALVPAASSQVASEVLPDLGLPPLPALTADSPLDTILFADRLEYAQDDGGLYAGTPQPIMFDGVLPPATTGTGIPEIFKYQLGNGYDPDGPAHPMVVAYHGFGASAASVASLSTLDEECDARNWIYMSPTGIDDKLFGAPISQQNVEAAIQWMVDTYNVDPDRIYMVGFSMGGGITANFAARRRDPDGVMIAAVGMVSATVDWTMEYVLGSPDLNDWLSNQYNFGGPPSTHGFNYKQASAAYFQEGSYPPLPGTLVGDQSMATNLGQLPMYMTYDTLDIINQVPLVNSALISYLDRQGAEVTTVVVTGTVNPENGTPATHSWIVLDEVALFDFFEGKVVDRTPAQFQALIDDDSTVSWLDVDKLLADEFAYVEGSLDVPGSSVDIVQVENVERAGLDAGQAGLAGLPHVLAQSADNLGFRLELGGTSPATSYLLDTLTADIVPGVDYDPLGSKVTVSLDAMATLEFDAVNEPDWDSVIVSAPHPAAVGGAATLTVDGPAAATTAWIFVGLGETLSTIKGLTFGVDSTIPGFVLPALPLDPLGDLTLPVSVPNDGALSGLRLPVQTILADAGFVPVSVSNIWGFEID